jgi:putative flippase GtrA
VGGSATLIQFAVLILMIELAGVNKIVASMVSYVISAGCNYLLNYYFTFSSQQSHWRTLPKFVVVVSIGLSVNTVTFSSALNIAPYILAQLVAVAAALLTNLLLHKYWIYRSAQ